MCVGLIQTHRAFAYNNAWANHRLLGACAELTQVKFEAERTGFFPSLQATLNHIYVIDLFYVDALEGRMAWTDGLGKSNSISRSCRAFGGSSVDGQAFDRCLQRANTCLAKRRGADQSRYSCPS